MTKYHKLESIFQKNQYSDILKASLRQNSHVRGYQSRLAEAAGVHSSYISRVINGLVHLTPDQAALLCRFWQFTVDETDYFMALLHLARAGSKELKTILTRQIREMRQKHDDLSHRFKEASVLESSSQGLYYSAWYFSAIHMLLLIPGHQTVKSIAQRLNLPPSLTESALHTLKALGQARQDEEKWSAVITDMHMGNQSSWASIYHSNLRQQVAARIHMRSEKDMHFSGLHAMTEQDYFKVKALLQDAMEKVRAIAQPSKAEELYCICLDWFQM